MVLSKKFVKYPNENQILKCKMQNGILIIKLRVIGYITFCFRRNILNWILAIVGITTVSNNHSAAIPRKSFVRALMMRIFMRSPG